MRTFIAIELGSEAQALVQAELLRLTRLAPAARWVRPESLHLSLSFLGEVADERVSDVGRAMARVAARHAPHRLRLHGSGTFGSLEAPRVLWVDVSGEVERLTALQSDLARELKALGLPLDFERFVPHVTLARSRDPRGDPALARIADPLRSVSLGDVPVQGFSLFVSESDRFGMRYRPLQTETLSGAPRTGAGVLRD